MPSETAVPLELVRFKLSPDDIDQLLARKDQWQAGDRQERCKIASQVYNVLKKQNPQWSEADRKLKKEGIYLWFHTYGRTRQSVEKFRDVKKWTARKVLGVEAEEDLKRIIRESTGGWNGLNSGKADNQKAFGTYQLELSKLWNTQSEKDKERLEEIARLWNETGPPAIQQAKTAEKAYKHEYMGQLGGKSFFQSNPDWETKPVMGLLSQHAKEMHEMDNTKIVTYGSTSRKPYLELDTDNNGHPLLPERSEWPKKSIEKKSLIRSYVAIAYRRATGNEHSIPPWTSIVQHPDMYFDPNQVPEGFTLLDPSKMKDPQIQQLLNYWYARQEDNEPGVGFQFQEDKNVKVHKRSHHLSDPDSDSDSDSEAEGRPPKKKPRNGNPDALVSRSGKGQDGKKGQGTVKAKAKAKDMGMGNGIGKAMGPGKAHPAGNGKGKEPKTWLDHIQPDSRRRKRAASVSSSGSGEHFNFSEVDKMPDSEDDHTQPGPSTLLAMVQSGKLAAGDKTVIRRSTRGPKSKQKDLEMISVTTLAGKLSIQPLHSNRSADAQEQCQENMVVDRKRLVPKKSTQQEAHACFVDIPARPSNGPPVMKRTTRSTTASMAPSIRLPAKPSAVHTPRKGKRSKARVKHDT